MKKALLLTTILFLFIAATHALITKGSILLGGDVGFGNKKTDKSDLNKQNDFFIRPTIGLAVKDNLVAGILGNYTHTKTTNNASYLTSDNTIAGGGLFLRRYFSVAKNFYLYGEGDLSYNYNKFIESTGIDSRLDSRINAVTLSLAPGLAYAVSKKFHLELAFNNLVRAGYDKTRTETTSIGGKTTEVSHSFGLSAG